MNWFKVSSTKYARNVIHKNLNVKKYVRNVYPLININALRQIPGILAGPPPIGDVVTARIRAISSTSCPLNVGRSYWQAAISSGMR